MRSMVMLRVMARITTLVMVMPMMAMHHHHPPPHHHRYYHHNCRRPHFPGKSSVASGTAEEAAPVSQFMLDLVLTKVNRAQLVCVLATSFTHLEEQWSLCNRFRAYRASWKYSIPIQARTLNAKHDSTQTQI